MKTYHIGLVHGGKIWTGGFRKSPHRHNTVIVQLRRCIDYLSCETWQYLGERETTKQSVYNKRAGLLAWINKEYGTDFKHILID